MNWARAIERNREALFPIIASLFAMLGLEGGRLVGRIPRSLHRAVLTLLRPTEAAVRRLVVIAARGLAVSLPQSRPWPKGHTIASGRTSRSSFRLVDPRKRFAIAAAVEARIGPRLHVVTGDPRIVALWNNPQAESTLPSAAETHVNALPLCNRLQALKRALDDLPYQARRLARWRQRRSAQASPKFTSPLRPGRPPGQRRRPVHDIDLILGECHALAFDAMKPDSS